MEKDFIDVSCSKFGTFTVQRLVENMKEDVEFAYLFNIIKQDIVKLAHHPKGNFVLLCIIGIIKENMFDQIIE